MTVSDALEKIRDMESAAKTFYRDGKILESQELDAKAQSLKKEIQEYQATAAAAARKEKRHDEWLTVDYSNPSPETIETAAKMGLDLTDPRYVLLLLPSYLVIVLISCHSLYLCFSLCCYCCSLSLRLSSMQSGLISQRDPTRFEEERISFCC